MMKLFGRLVSILTGHASKATEQPMVVVEEPRVVADVPKMVTQEHRVVDEPRAVTDIPKFVAQAPGGVIEEPEIVVDVEVPSDGSASGGIIVSFQCTAPEGLQVVVSDAEVAYAAARYGFVLDSELSALSALKTVDRWFEEKTHKRRLRDGSEKAFAWLEPFIPVELVKREQLKAAASEFGPGQAPALASELRALVRERRKAGQPHTDLLQALYGACMMADFVDSLRFEGIQPHALTRYVSVADLQPVKVEYARMGYKCIEALSKTDTKWLIEAFGEPAEHQSFNGAWPAPMQNAISRYCWSEFNKSNQVSRNLEQPVRTMQEWLNWHVSIRLYFDKEGQARGAAFAAQHAEARAGIEAAWLATEGTFVVADLETTGLNSGTDEVLEFGAVRARSDGSVEAAISMLVRPENGVPHEITRLTGITNAEATLKGRALDSAFGCFLDFIGPHPVFFHNAPFDVGFLKIAAAKTRRKFANPVHDTLPLARHAWPQLRNHKLSDLARHAGAPEPGHRALDDAKATLHVLMAAKAAVRR